MSAGPRHGRGKEDSEPVVVEKPPPAPPGYTVSVPGFHQQTDRKGSPPAPLHRLARLATLQLPFPLAFVLLPPLQLGFSTQLPPKSLSLSWFSSSRSILCQGLCWVCGEIDVSPKSPESAPAILQFQPTQRQDGSK
eukprot:3020086-Rhodomonas_salina.1